MKIIILKDKKHAQKQDDTTVKHIWKRISNSKKNVKKIVSECFKSFRDSRREVYVVCMHEYK